jgi:hypothetical protein
MEWGGAVRVGVPRGLDMVAKLGGLFVLSGVELVMVRGGTWFVQYRNECVCLCG